MHYSVNSILRDGESGSDDEFYTDHSSDDGPLDDGFHPSTIDSDSGTVLNNQHRQ